METIQLQATEKKSHERGSFDYVKRGRPGNPTSIHPDSFVCSKNLVFQMDDGTTHRILAGDEDTLDHLIELARKRGISGVYQVRRAYGGVGNGKSAALRASIKYGSIDTKRSGFPIIFRDLEI